LLQRRGDTGADAAARTQRALPLTRRCERQGHWHAADLSSSAGSAGANGLVDLGANSLERLELPGVLGSLVDEPRVVVVVRLLLDDVLAVELLALEVGGVHGVLGLVLIVRQRHQARLPLCLRSLVGVQGRLHGGDGGRDLRAKSKSSRYNFFETLQTSLKNVRNSSLFS